MTLGTKFLALSPTRCALVFEQAAAGQAGQAVILEKDFWVTWLLGRNAAGWWTGRCLTPCGARFPQV